MKEQISKGPFTKNWETQEERLHNIGERHGRPQELIQKAIDEFNQKPIILGQGELYTDESGRQWGNGKTLKRTLQQEFDLTTHDVGRWKLGKSGPDIKVGKAHAHLNFFYPLDQTRNEVKTHLKEINDPTQLEQQLFVQLLDTMIISNESKIIGPIFDQLKAKIGGGTIQKKLLQVLSTIKEITQLPIPTEHTHNRRVDKERQTEVYMFNRFIRRKYNFKPLTVEGIKQTNNENLLTVYKKAQDENPGLYMTTLKAEEEMEKFTIKLFEELRNLVQTDRFSQAQLEERAHILDEVKCGEIATALKSLNAVRLYAQYAWYLLLKKHGAVERELGMRPL